MTSFHPNGNPRGDESVAELSIETLVSRQSATARFDGVAVSPGVAVARAQCLHDIPVGSVTDPIDETEVLSELSRFEEALQLTAGELESLRQKVATEVGEEEADIFGAHLLILKDPALLEKIQRDISERRLSAVAALHRVAAEYEELFGTISDPYLKERVADLRDILRRLGRNVVKAAHWQVGGAVEPVVLVAYELLPSDVLAVTEANIAAIVTETGGRTSHAGILARSYGIPAVSGVAGVRKHVTNGDTVIVDGSSGHVFVNPTEQTLRAYRTRQKEFAQLRRQLAAEPIRPTQTADSQALELLANVNCAYDLEEAAQVGAAGVGLYRTEFFFLTHPNVPDEDEQTDNYSRMIVESPGNTFTIRTLDLGGDKTIPYMTHTLETNPFMGWRSIRLSFQHPEFFQTQIRAVLRAAADKDKEVRLLFPMITTPEELQAIGAMVRRARSQLCDKELPCGKVRIGMMVEVPAAAVALDMFLDDVDFVSIGSNDLVQYLTAADRDNPRVSHLCQVLNPAVLRVLSSVIGTCVATRKCVTLCGEAASSPRAFILLLGMGLTSFSMSPAFIPSIRDLAARLTIPQSQTILNQAMQIRSAAAISHFMDRQIKQICPELIPFLIA